MALPDVKILLQNGSLGGLVAFAEGVAGFIGTGVSVSGKITVGTPRVIFSLLDAVNLGIDATNNPVAYRHLKEFYGEAGTGKECYILLVPNTMTQTDMWDLTNANGIVKLLSFAQGRIRLASSFFTPASGYTLVTTNGVDADVFDAIVEAHATAEAFAVQQSPLRCVIEGRAFNGDASTLTDLTTMSKNRVAVCIGSTLSNGTASVGLVLGRLASIPVQRKISRIKDGSLNITAGYVGSADVKSYSGLALMHDKGYIVLRVPTTKTGYYFNGDHTCAPNTDDYSMICRGRVIDKAQVIAYGTFIDEVDDEVLVDATGKLDIGLITYLQTKIDNQVNSSMVSARELSGFSSFIDPAQNILSTNKLQVVIKPRPVGYSSNIEVLLGFDNPNV